MKAMIPPGATVALFAKPGHPDAPRLLEELGAWLSARGYRPAPGPEPAAALAVVLGGDGTILHVAARLAAARTPILAVHLGTLGFLTEVALADLYPSLERALAGEAASQNRALLRVRFEPKAGPAETFDALNEAVIAKRGARLIRLELGIDRERVGRCRADGVLVATATGSTAYSLSAGGPVLHPALDALVVTPICPHALNQRPIVVPGRCTVTLELAASEESACLTVDGHPAATLAPGDRVVCARSPLSLTLLSPRERSFYDSLRSKLGWGGGS